MAVNHFWVAERGFWGEFSHIFGGNKVFKSGPIFSDQKRRFWDAEIRSFVRKFMWVGNSPQKPCSATQKWFFGHRYVQNVRFLRNSQTGMRENQNLYSPIYLLTKSSLGQMALSENIKSLRGRGVLYSSGREGPFNRGCIRNVLASEWEMILVQSSIKLTNLRADLTLFWNIIIVIFMIVLSS